MTTWLSSHFALEELVATAHRGIDNRPPPAVRIALRDTAQQMEAVRRVLGDRPISFNSGFRCAQLNAAVGGAANSAHLSGHAADFNCYGFGDPGEVCHALDRSDLEFDQIIEEGSWVHISFDPRMRRQVMTRTRTNGYAQGLAA